MSKEKINLELLTSDVDDSKRVGEFIQSNLMKNLPGLNLTVKSIPLKSRLANTTNHNYDFVFGTWQPSYEDPLDFLTVGGLFNLQPDYHNDNFWHQIDMAKTTYATNPKKRLQALINAENQLIKKDAFCNVMDIGNVFTKLFLNHFCDIFGITGVAAEKDASDSHE